MSDNILRDKHGNKIGTVSESTNLAGKKEYTARDNSGNTLSTTTEGSGWFGGKEYTTRDKHGNTVSRTSEGSGWFGGKEYTTRDNSGNTISRTSEGNSLGKKEYTARDNSGNTMGSVVDFSGNDNSSRSSNGRSSSSNSRGGKSSSYSGGYSSGGHYGGFSSSTNSRQSVNSNRGLFGGVMGFLIVASALLFTGYEAWKDVNKDNLGKTNKISINTDSTRKKESGGIFSSLNENSTRKKAESAFERRDYFTAAKHYNKLKSYQKTQEDLRKQDASLDSLEIRLDRLLDRVEGNKIKLTDKVYYTISNATSLVMRSDPNRKDRCYVFFAREDYLRGHPERAIEEYDSSLKYNPNNLDALLNKAKIQMLNEDYSDAFYNYEEYIKKEDPEKVSPQTYFNIGLVSARLAESNQDSLDFFDKNFEDMNFYYMVAIENEPNNKTKGIYVEEFGNSLFKLGYYKAALQQYNRSIELNKRNFDSWDNRAEAASLQ